MASTSSFRFDGYSIPITVGTGYGDGVIVQPNKYDIDDPQYIAALKKALALYPLVDDIAELENYASGYARESTTEAQLRNYLYGFDEEDFEKWTRIIEVAENQDLIPVNDYMRRFIEAIRWEIERRIRKAEKEQRKQERIRNMAPGYVYLLQSPTGYYKIGRTKDPNDRMATFSVKLPFEVEYACLIHTQDMHKLESDLHEMFSQKRVNGEWFSLNDTDVDHIKGLSS